MSQKVNNVLPLTTSYGTQFYVDSSRNSRNQFNLFVLSLLFLNGILEVGSCTFFLPILMYHWKWGRNYCGFRLMAPSWFPWSLPAKLMNCFRAAETSVSTIRGRQVKIKYFFYRKRIIDDKMKWFATLRVFMMPEPVFKPQYRSFVTHCHRKFTAEQIEINGDVSTDLCQLRPSDMTFLWRKYSQ